MSNFGTIGPQDMGRKREFTHEGTKFIFEAHDPYGFVTVFNTKTNKKFDGQYTGFKEAETAATNFVNKSLSEKVKAV